MRRGRLDVGVSCAGNHTHLYGAEELFRSIYTKREFEDKWGIKTRTMLMSDNPGMSWSIVAPYADADVFALELAPFGFATVRLDYEVKVEGDALKLTLTETNTGAEPFEAAGGFHPYFKVASPLCVAVDGEQVTTECYRVSEPALGGYARIFETVSGYFTLGCLFADGYLKALLQGTRT
jgi:hypothetical protein